MTRETDPAQGGALGESTAARAPAETRTAAAKVLETLRALSQPDPGGDEWQLMLSTVAMGLEGMVGPQLEAMQASGDLDEWVAAMVKWLATLRSDTARRLVVAELPRSSVPLAPGVRLHHLDEAIAQAESAPNPLTS